MSDRSCDNLISVIVPVYNASPWLEQCIDSIIAQTHQELEIILVDDGSTDGSGTICDEYTSRDSRIRVIHQQNRGVGSARNAGLAGAAGGYIGWVDADDWIEPDMFRKLISLDADLAVCGYIASPDSDGRLQCFEPAARYDQPQVMGALAQMDGWTILWNKLYRRKLWEDITFPECKVFDDETVSFRILSRASNMVVLNEVFYHYRIHPRSVMRRYQPGECLEPLDDLCSQYHVMKDEQFSIYCLAGIYHVLRGCMRAMAGDHKTYHAMKQRTASARTLIAERRRELAVLLKCGIIGRMELAAVAGGSFLACGFSSLCQKIYDRKSRCRRSLNKV